MIAVYTCITGGYELPKVPQHQDGADWFLFTDDPGVDIPPPWQKVLIEPRFKNPQLEARFYKMTPEIWFPDYDIWVWLDGSMIPTVPIPKLVAECPGQITVFQHPDRRCLYEEGWTVKACNLAPRQAVDKQLDLYEKVGYPKKNGLGETKVVIRQNTPAIIVFNRRWLHEVVTQSHRDQLSLNFVSWILCIPISYMPPSLYRDKDETKRWFNYTKHRQRRYQ